MPQFKEIYTGILAHALTRQASDGSMPAGHNGHYHDPETPVRNTSHYLIAFLRAWELTGDERFRNAATNCLSWLLVDNPHRQGNTFHHRSKVGKDKCNGLIGPAWNMEALLFAEMRLNAPKARDLARDLFLLHPYDANNKVWHRVEPNGNVLAIDSTFNHQLWFAACAAPLMSDTPEAQESINGFIEQLCQNWSLAPSGRIIHPLWLPRRRLRERCKRLIKPAYRKAVISKEIGYQAFNLYGFSLLKLANVSLPQCERQRVDKALEYLCLGEFSSGIESAKCGFPYNPPGWEVPVALSVLSEVKDEVYRPWIKRQLMHSYDPKSNMLSRGTADIETHTARIYETARLRDSVFNLEFNIL